MASGITRTITGELTLTDRYELTANDDLLEISSAVINLNSPAGEIFTNEGDDTVTITDSTINAQAENLSFFLGSGSDTLVLNNSILNAPILTGSGNDLVRITGNAQSKVILTKRASSPTLSLGANDDILELGAILEGDGDIDFGTGNDTLRFDGGSLLTTGSISKFSNLQVTAGGGTLGRNLEISGDQITITLGGNLTGTDNSKQIFIAGEKIFFNTANNVKMNIGFSIAEAIFTHMDGGTLEINGCKGYAFLADSSSVSLHDMVIVNAGGGLKGTDTFWSISNSNFSNSLAAAVLTGGTLDLINIGVSNNRSSSLDLTGTALTGEDLSFTRNQMNGANQAAMGGAIKTNADVNLKNADLISNSASASASVFLYVSASASAFAMGGAIYQSGGEMTLTSATFSGNSTYAYATAITSAYVSASASAFASAYVSASASAMGGAIYQSGGEMTLTSVTFSGNSACAYASADVYSSIHGYINAPASAMGGAIYQSGGEMTLISTTFSGNSAYAYASANAYTRYNYIDAFAFAMGGAIYQSGGEMTLTSATFSGNSAYAYAYGHLDASAMGGAICAEKSIINLTNTTFIGNSVYSYSNSTAGTASAMGGAIYLNNNSILSYSVSEDRSIINTGNIALDSSHSAGGFLYLSGNSQATFDIAGELTVGNADGADSIGGDATTSITKSGTGVWTILSDVSGFAGNWNITAGVLKLERIAREITLDYWTVGVDAELHLSALDDSITMGMDKRIGIINLGGGSDTVNTNGYTLSGGKLLISTLTLTGGGTISSTIATRDADAGFDLILDEIKLNSDIIGGNANDSIRITQSSRLGGTIDLGDGANSVTAEADTAFLGTFRTGNGNDTLRFSTVEFQQSTDFGDGKNTLTVTERAVFAGTLYGGAGDDTLDLHSAEFRQNVDLGSGKNTLKIAESAIFSDRLSGGDGNDTITLGGDAQLNGLISLGGGRNTISANGELSIRDGFLLNPAGETRLVVNLSANLAGNSLNVYSHEGATLKALTLNWSSIPDLDKVRIVVSSDASFHNFEFAVELYNQSKSFTLNIEESYYIQFQAQDEDGWKQRYLPDTVAPDQVTGLLVENGIARWTVTHDNWGGNGVKQYHVEVSSDADFGNILDSMIVTETEYSFAELGDGVYYWRVRAEDYTSNTGKWSETEMTVVDQTAPSTPRGLVSTTGDYSVLLDWSEAIDSGSGVAHYEYRIATDSSFASITVSGESITTANVAVHKLAYGDYYWQVRAVDNAGNIGEWSLYKKFTIADTIAPTAPGQLDYQLDGNTVTLDWLASLDDASGSGLKEYRIEFSDQADFSKIILSRTSSSTRISIDDLAGGNYFCRVSAVDQSGNVSEWSNVQNFQIEEPSPSAGPTKSDFDGNGVSDILFQNLVDSANPLGAWMNADKWQWNGALGAAPKSDWTVYGAYDFTGDGVCDIMFRSKLASTEYAVGYYDMGDNATFKTMGWGVTAEWELADVGDFNGSGRADILWKNSTNGYLGLWMDGTDQWVALPASNLGEGQSIIGIGDVNGDGCDDILINSNGVLGAWDISGIINGTADAPVWSSFGINIGSEWDAFGCADFDGNGKADIVLWRDSDGYVGTYMNCNVNDFRGIYPGASKDEWGLPGFGDYNGDGCDDVLVRNLASGALGYWDGADDFKWNEIGSGVDSTWAVIA